MSSFEEPNIGRYHGMNNTTIFWGIIAGFSLLAYPLLVLLHELGHAVPALLLTRKPVTVYLGSYGDRDNTWRVQVGALEFYLKRSLFWTKGLCVHTGSDLSKTAHVIIILGGVFVSVLIAVLSFYSALVFNLHGFLKLLLFFLTIYAAASIVINLVPSRRGDIANDGMLLKQLLASSKDSFATKFSAEIQELIAGSRLVAIDLGYDYISTLHLFLADCAMPYAYSLAGLFFPNQADYTAFYESCRIGPANSNAGSLPLTQEFEQALKHTYLSQQYGFRSELYPCHLFMAASKVPDAVWLSGLPAASDMPQRLLAHYHTFAELLSD